LRTSSNDSGEYRDDTESHLNDNSQVEDAVGGDVSNTDCDEPSSTNVGTHDECTADVEGVGSLQFDVEIDKLDSFIIQEFELP
jgi:hypothetical protein